MVITADAHLDSACTYTGGVDIVTVSNVVFDCRGAHITDVKAAMDAVSLSAPTPKRRLNTSR